MTFREIGAVIVHSQERSHRLAAFTAYHTASLVRAKHIPGNIIKTFPTLFGRTSDGQIKAENWEESARAMRRIAAQFKKQKEGRTRGS